MDISSYIQPGDNTLAMMIAPPYCEGDFCPERSGDYTDDFAIGFVDWAPIPPDYNMGVYRTVSIKTLSRKIDIYSVSVDTLALDILEQDSTSKISATVQPRLMIHNYHHQPQSLTIEYEFNGLSSHQIQVTLKPDSEQELLLPVQRIEDAKLWWPHTMGEPYLYALNIKAALNSNNKEVIYNTHTEFGVRKVEAGVATSPDNQTHYRCYQINGQPLQNIGSGWTDAIFLNDSPARITTKLHYIKDMNFNTIRLEGFWGSNQLLYDLADKLGLLLLPGWSAAWDWPYYVTFQSPDAPNLPSCDKTYGCILSADDQSLISEAFKSQLLLLRKHPSILGWFVDSDHQPLSDLE